MIATYKNSDRTLTKVKTTSHVLWTRMLTLDRWTKMVGDHERFFLTTFLILLKVSDDWALPDYLPTIRNIYGNHGQNYLIK